MGTCTCRTEGKIFKRKSSTTQLLILNSHHGRSPAVFCVHWWGLKFRFWARAGCWDCHSAVRGQQWNSNVKLLHGEYTPGASFNPQLNCLGQNSQHCPFCWYWKIGQCKDDDKDVEEGEEASDGWAIILPPNMQPPVSHMVEIPLAHFLNTFLIWWRWWWWCWLSF